MRNRFGIAFRTGLLILVFVGSFGVLQIAGLSPADAVCGNASNTQVASGTRVCPGDNDISNCTTVENGIKTCAVRQLGNGLMFLALATVIAGVLVSSILWAVGSRGQNAGQELTGKRGLVVCATAAMLIGAYPILSTFFHGLSTRATLTSPALRGRPHRR